MRGGCRNVQGKVRRRELRCRGKEEREERVGRERVGCCGGSGGRAVDRARVEEMVWFATRR